MQFIIPYKIREIDAFFRHDTTLYTGVIGQIFFQLRKKGHFSTSLKKCSDAENYFLHHMRDSFQNVVNLKNLRENDGDSIINTDT